MAGTWSSGPKSRPAALRELTGARTRARHKDQHWSHAVGLPDVPEMVSTDPLALERWNILAPRIAAVKVLTEAHGEMLGVLCITWADLVRALREFAAMGYRMLITDVRVNRDGQESHVTKANPLLGKMERLNVLVAKFLGEFGLTPMSAAKVGTAEVAADDPFDEFLKSENPYGTSDH